MTARVAVAPSEPPSSLAARLARLIAAGGPISVAQYMAAANAHYYASREPFGSAGDFITAPEVSQTFGEMIGIWLADLWQRAGRPAPVHYVEAGPGRGTLARDALRVMARFGLVPQVHLVETSTRLRACQAEWLPAAHWHADFSTLPEDGALLFVANEFLDALPVRQLVKTAAGWRERLVGHRDGRFRPVAGERPMDAAVPSALRAAQVGAILETSPAAAAMVADIAARIAAQGGAALVIDYGHDESRLGSTLQAVRAHAGADPFADPGEADLTALVDFSVLAPIAQTAGVRWLGTIEQRHFLAALGIAARIAMLARRAPARRDALEAALARLTAPDQMGQLFKVMALAAKGWPDGAGFAPA